MERSCHIKGALVAAVERNADEVLGSMRNRLLWPVVVEMGKAFLEQGLHAHVTFQRRQRKRLWEGLQLCAGNHSSGLESLG